MSHNTAVMDAVESLDYRVTVGDIAGKAGIELAVAQQGLNALAADTQAHLQVSDAGEIAYEFPKDFRGILRNKYWRIRLQETWFRIWGVLFYLIRVSFGLLLLLSLALIVIAIFVILIAASSSQRDDNDRGGGLGGGMVFIPRFWFGDIFWLFHYNSGYSYERRRTRQPSRRDGAGQNEMNFLEAVFSFLFGDGDPNADLEERRWQTVGTVIQNNGGAIAAEQVLPYLDGVDDRGGQAADDYVLPVLTRFNGVPQVSDKGDIVYHFPELQVTAGDRRNAPVAAYLRESLRPFSRATRGQITGAICLGTANFLGALFLGNLLQDQGMVAELGGIVAFVNSIYWLLLAYGTAFLAIPAVRFFWNRFQNRRIADRNEARQDQAIALNEAGPELQEKIAFAHQFAAKTIVQKDDLAYTTETDLTDQEFEQRQKLDAEWQKRLNQSNS